MLDGSLTGSKSMLATYYDHLVAPDCEAKLEEFNSIVCINDRRIAGFHV